MTFHSTYLSIALRNNIILMGRDNIYSSGNIYSLQYRGGDMQYLSPFRHI